MDYSGVDCREVDDKQYGFLKCFLSRYVLVQDTAVYENYGVVCFVIHTGIQDSGCVCEARRTQGHLKSNWKDCTGWDTDSDVLVYDYDFGRLFDCCNVSSSMNAVASDAATTR